MNTVLSIIYERSGYMRLVQSGAGYVPVTECVRLFTNKVLLVPHASAQSVLANMGQASQATQGLGTVVYSKKPALRKVRNENSPAQRQVVDDAPAFDSDGSPIHDTFVADVAIFVLKRDVKLQLTNCNSTRCHSII